MNYKDPPKIDPKAPKPSLGGTRIRTRKRNIAVPLDPSSFAEAVIVIFTDAAEAATEGEGAEERAALTGAAGLESDLDAAVKTLETSELDFSRYGDTLFEVLFSGQIEKRGGAGGSKDEDEASMATYMLAGEPERATVQPYVNIMQQLIRRRPFLIKNLENVLVRHLRSLEHFDAMTRAKLAIATSLILAQKLGPIPENVLPSLLTDAMVAKGTVLQFVTALFKDFLSDSPLDDLVALLRKAKLDDRLLELFPPQKRSIEEFKKHFEAEGLSALVDYNTRRVSDAKLKEVAASVAELMAEGADVNEAIELVRAKRREGPQLPDGDVIKTLWGAVLDPQFVAGKDAQQIGQAALKQVRTWVKLLGAFTTSGKLELELLYQVQTSCYDEAKLLKSFPDIVKLLYNAEVLAEDTVLFWFRKGTNTKGRAVLVKELEPLVKWLEEAEEEDE